MFDAGLFSSVRALDKNEPAQAHMDIPDPGLTQLAASHELHPAASIEQSPSAPSDMESLSNRTDMEEISQQGFTYEALPSGKLPSQKEKTPFATAVPATSQASQSAPSGEPSPSAHREDIDLHGREVLKRLSESLTSLHHAKEQQAHHTKEPHVQASEAWLRATQAFSKVKTPATMVSGPSKWYNIKQWN
jgi:hypothetical protein